ncbi:MAG: NADAR family protein [Defluviicoccus sp.]|nr:NADAR family protein [Defluviicoccus sp.]
MEETMRTYPANDVCGFRFSRAEWGEFSNFCPLPAPIPAGPWLFPTSEHLYQAAKFAVSPNIQAHIAAAPTARDAARIGRNPGLPAHPLWTRQRVDVMRWVLRRKLETLPDWISPVLAATDDRPIVEISTRDPYWGARPEASPARAGLPRPQRPRTPLDGAAPARP